jgi:hypothetical protein
VKVRPPSSLPDAGAGRRHKLHRRRRGLAHRISRRLPRADVRWFFGVSLFTYAVYDFSLKPLLAWLAGLLTRH